MKKAVLFLAFLATLAVSFAQDSSRMDITLTLRVKNYALMGSYLQKFNRLEDSRLRDSIAKAVGSGTDMDSLSTMTFKTGIVLKYIQSLMDEQSGAAYDITNELATLPIINGGLLTQLTLIRTGVGPQKAAAIWLHSHIAKWFGSKKAVMTEKLNSGVQWLKSTISYN